MRLAFDISLKGTVTALALLAMVSPLSTAALSQSRDHTWTPDVPNMGPGTYVPSVPQNPVADPVAPKQLVEKDGAASFQNKGDYSFTIPDYTTITFQVNGAGGSAARPVNVIGENPTRYDPDFGTPGNDGSNSNMPKLNLTGGGGGAGNGVTAIYKGGCYPKCKPPYPYSTIGNDSVTMTFYRGTDGGASGGDVNQSGGAGNGGAATEVGGRNGGGNGGRAIRTFSKGQGGAPAPGQVVSMHVGAGGEPAVVTEPMRINGIGTLPGGDGSVFITWKYLAYQ